MSKKTYLIFHQTGNVEKIKGLNADLYEASEAGTITLVDPKALKFLDEELSWEDIPLQQKEEDEEEEEEEILIDDEHDDDDL